ncbi:Protein YIM1-1 [Lachancea thermotolerans]|uniref:Protein YIM1-1 n=1 Tax=Lachancea thermotolerans (strain ATCC 56472 / CBS 6340 / NRRL Y-8284) TaxID=559295 RepID=YIM11_LACTC|nr:KLTH0H15928p [Lachancea thermotolerans CBS 6340]C5E3S4.1 RecName: Full=Protein YIM1-1 [Lachancea thermotolerans CBS 6340]CAR30685.1 KLTH0H15928p [Lachancea thermotolerans CBS 6340]
MSESVANRAVVFYNNKSLPIISSEELNLDSCYSSSEVVIRVHAAALNPVDFLLQSFAYSWLVGRGPKTFSRDYSGEVVRAGANVKDFKVGDKVSGLFQHLYGKQGTLCDYLILDPVKQPAISKLAAAGHAEYDDYVVNAAWPLVFGTAYQGLTNFGQKLGPDSKILVIGASTSVSNAFVQIAKNHLKVGTVVGICSKKSFDYNKKLGYDYLAAYDDGSVVDSVKDIIGKNLNNEKFDLIFDSVGNSDFFGCINDVLKDKGQNSQFVSLTGDKKMNYSSPRIWDSLPGLESLKRYGPFRKYNYNLFMLRSDSAFMKLGYEMISEKQYMPAIDSVYSFDDYAKAFERVKSNRSKGKVVIKIH